MFFLKRTPWYSLLILNMYVSLYGIFFSPPGTEEVESPRVVTVMLPEHRGYFVQHLGYFLATFLLMAFIVLAVVVLTRRRKKRGTVPLTFIFLLLTLARHFYYGGKTQCSRAFCPFCFF